MMKITTLTTQNGITAVHITDLDEPISVFKTFDCGQCFRFDPVSIFGNKYEFGGVAFGRYVIFAQNSENELIIYNSTLEEYNSLWRSYLALDKSYTKINEDILSVADSEHMKKAVEYGNGIRILRQDAWECVISFIISQNNNIPRIKKIISALCEKYGEERSFLGAKYYTFPSESVLSGVSEEDIFALKTGFRAKYIADACRSVIGGETVLSYIPTETDFDKCLNYLCKIKGIGLKVASCILLFGFDKTESFPIDVHIKRTLEKYFPNGIDLAALGKNAGIAQQYLFYFEKYNQNS